MVFLKSRRRAVVSKSILNVDDYTADPANRLYVTFRFNEGRVALLYGQTEFFSEKSLVTVHFFRHVCELDVLTIRFR